LLLWSCNEREREGLRPRAPDEKERKGPREKLRTKK